MSSIPQKVCTRCGLSLPATPDFWRRNARQKDGLDRTCCKACHAAAYRSNPEPERQRANAKRLANADRYREYDRMYYRENKERWAEKADQRKQWRASNKDRMALLQKRWCKANRERINARAKELRDRNPNYWRTKYKQRHARKRNAPGTYTYQDVLNRYQAQNGRCYWCNCALGEKYEIDHYIPLIRGGSNYPDNIVLACRFCNRSKKDRLPDEWPQRPKHPTEE